METRPNDISGEKNKPRLINQKRSSAESIPSGSSNEQELGKPKGKKRKRSDTDLNAPKAPLPADDRFLNEPHENIFPRGPQKSHLQEAEKGRYMKELDKNRQNDAHGNSVAGRKALKKVGKNQVKSKEDALETTSYKNNHLSVHVHPSETEQTIRSLRNLLAYDLLATEEACTEADSLFNISLSHRKPGGAKVMDSLVDFHVPKLLTNVLRSLYRKYPNIFSSEEQTNSEVKCAVRVIYAISVAILNFSDLHDKFCEACGQAGVVKECLKLLGGLKMCTHDFSDTRAILQGPEGTKNRFSPIGDVGLEVLGVIYNLSRRINNKKYFDSCAVETLLSFYQTKIPEYRVTALLCLAYLVDEMNNNLIMATKGPVKQLLKLLEGACNSDDRRYQGYSATEIAQGLSYVASNDKNKKMIGQLGGISVLAAMLNDSPDQGEKSAAANALYVLSFHKENKDIIKDYSDLLQNLQNSDDKEIQQAASGVMWEITGKQKQNTKISDSQRHIMISYQWDCQDTMLLVKEELESKCFRVWIDVDNMTGDIIDAMARAVEKSGIFLMAMSRKYQNSNNCRSEASYAHKLGKQIIPLMMEDNYKPDGWLGLILSTKLYMHFEKDPSVGIRQLLKEIANVTAADMG